LNQRDKRGHPERANENNNTTAIVERRSIESPWVSDDQSKALVSFDPSKTLVSIDQSKALVSFDQSKTLVSINQSNALVSL
jgi:hypothetical protein